MDYSWLAEETEFDNLEQSEKSDSEEIDNELESRLYSIVHHNDLSQPLPPELAKQYSIQHSDDGEIMVSLLQPVEEVEASVVPESATKANSENKVEVVEISDDDVVVTDIVTKHNFTKKRVRYSDVNIDELNQSQIEEETIIPRNYNKFITNNYNAFLKTIKTRKFKKFWHINLPESINFSAWESECANSYNEIENNKILRRKCKLREKLRELLRDYNPNINKGTLHNAVELFFSVNKRLIKNKRNNNVLQWSDVKQKDECTAKYQNKEEISSNMIINISGNNVSNHRLNGQFEPQSKDLLQNGSVSLHCSPFKPTTLVINKPKVNTTICDSSAATSYIPPKWTKKMIKFYTIPSKKKMRTNIDDIFMDFKMTTTQNDWMIDANDETGVYHRNNLHYTTHRCNNCKQKGHATKLCPEPKRISACYLCGESNHHSYNCHNSICLKCGKRSKKSECDPCYYTVCQRVSCEMCNSCNHRSVNCPDSWRRFHSTTGGEVKIPESSLENERKYCSNCGYEGHFSHNCTAPYQECLQISPFVTNYVMEPLELGSTEILFSNELEMLIKTKAADTFLRNLSNSTLANLEINQVDTGVSLVIRGTFSQCSIVKNRVEEYMNTLKRTPNQPRKKRKRQKLH